MEQNDKDEEAAPKPAAVKAGKVGERIIKGLEEALAWSKGENLPVRVTQVHVPEVDVSKVRRLMGLSQTQFGLEIRISTRHAPELGTGRVWPDTPTPVLLAVIEKHPESVEDVLKDLR